MGWWEKFQAKKNREGEMAIDPMEVERLAGLKAKAGVAADHMRAAVSGFGSQGLAVGIAVKDGLVVAVLGPVEAFVVATPASGAIEHGEKGSVPAVAAKVERAKVDRKAVDGVVDLALAEAVQHAAGTHGFERV